MAAFWDSLKHVSVNLEDTTEESSPQIGRKFGAIVPTVGLRAQCKIAILVFGKMCVECLHKVPDDWRSFGRRVRTILVTEAEASARRLVNVEHVGVSIPTVRVQHRIRSRDVVEGAWAILLEEANHAATTRAPIEPQGKGCSRTVVACFEEPKPYMLRTRQPDEYHHEVKNYSHDPHYRKNSRSTG